MRRPRHPPPRERWAILDLETTGLRDHHEIVEVAVLDADGRVLVDTLVRPSGAVPPAATRIHGLDAAALADAPRWRDVWPRVASATRGRTLVGYGIAFDLRALRRANDRIGAPLQVRDIFDVRRFFRERHPEAPGSRLGDAASHCGLEPLPAHRGRTDAEQTRRLLLALLGERAQETHRLCPHLS